MPVNRHEGERRNVPFDCAYWVVPRQFLAGCYPGSRNLEVAHQKLKALLDHGIRHVINLMEGDERNWDGRPFESYEEQMQSIAASMGHTVTFDKRPIKDARIPSRVEMSQILDRIDECIRDAKPVYVHCWGGRGRTGTVVGCFLARHGMASGKNVLHRIRELQRGAGDYDYFFPSSPETKQQADFVLSWVEAE